MLTHKQVAQLHPLSSYALGRKPPEWVLFHTFSICENNYISITSETCPELCVPGDGFLLRVRLVVVPHTGPA